MAPVNLRHAVRALVLDEEDRVLLCRLVFRKPTGTEVVWAAPGGGVEQGETLVAALRRELREEIGLGLDAEPPHVWHQVVVAADHAPGHDGVLNDYFLVRNTAFVPRGALSDEELAAENLRGTRWWRPADIADYRGPDLFSPRDLATPLNALLARGVPVEPVRLGP